MFIDTHVHSTFSSDGEATPREHIEAAIALNLGGICFTEHYDEENKYEFNNYLFKDYFPEILSLREEYKGRIKVLTGVELGLQPRQSVKDKSYETMKGFSFDFIAGSTHLVDNMDPYYPEYYENRTKAEAYGAMIDEITKNIRFWPDIDAVSHFDYLARYSIYEDKRFLLRDVKDKIDIMFKELISREKALEINTKTYSRVPLDEKILVRYKELGGYLITLGSDGHRTSEIGREFSKYADIIKNCGFKYIAHFENRKPVLVKI